MTSQTRAEAVEEPPFSSDSESEDEEYDDLLTRSEEEEDLDYDEQLEYSDECPSLPASRPVGFPHVINAAGFAEETDAEGLTLADGIATFLWKWDRSQFENFFDMSRKKFELHYDAPDQIIKDMIISRDGNRVLAGFRVDDHRGGKEWDPQLVFSIEQDGSWIGRMCSEGNGRENVEFWGMMFSKQVFYHSLWEVWEETTKIKVY